MSRLESRVSSCKQFWDALDPQPRADLLASREEETLALQLPEPNEEAPSPWLHAEVECAAHARRRTESFELRWPPRAVKSARRLPNSVVEWRTAA